MSTIDLSEFDFAIPRRNIGLFAGPLGVENGESLPVEFQSGEHGLYVQEWYGLVSLHGYLGDPGSRAPVTVSIERQTGEDSWDLLHQWTNLDTPGRRVARVSASLENDFLRVTWQFGEGNIPPHARLGVKIVPIQIYVD